MRFFLSFCCVTTATLRVDDNHAFYTFGCPKDFFTPTKKDPKCKHLFNAANTDDKNRWFPEKAWFWSVSSVTPKPVWRAKARQKFAKSFVTSTFWAHIKAKHTKKTEWTRTKKFILSPKQKQARVESIVGWPRNNLGPERVFIANAVHPTNAVSPQVLCTISFLLSPPNKTEQYPLCHSVVQLCCLKSLLIKAGVLSNNCVSGFSPHGGYDLCCFFFEIKQLANKHKSTSHGATVSLHFLQ